VSKLEQKGDRPSADLWDLELSCFSKRLRNCTYIISAEEVFFFTPVTYIFQLLPLALCWPEGRHMKAITRWKYNHNKAEFSPDLRLRVNRFLVLFSFSTLNTFSRVRVIYLARVRCERDMTEGQNRRKKGCEDAG